MTGARLSPGCAIFSSQRRPDRLWDNIFSTSRSFAWGTVSSFSPRGLIHWPRTPVQLFTVPVKFRTAAHFTTFQTHCHCHCHFRRTIKCYITYTLKQASFAYSKVSKAVSRSDNGEQMMGLHTDGRTDNRRKYGSLIWVAVPLVGRKWGKGRPVWGTRYEYGTSKTRSTNAKTTVDKVSLNKPASILKRITAAAEACFSVI